MLTTRRICYKIRKEPKMGRKKKLDNLIPYISQEDIFLTCINFDQAYKHFMSKVEKLSNTLYLKPIH